MEKDNFSSHPGMGTLFLSAEDDRTTEILVESRIWISDLHSNFITKILRFMLRIGFGFQFPWFRVQVGKLELKT
ncbi:hypothetical protein BTVI_30631 [Pitangus sulphuratus]|nr:hypothetical protein BTVI_30631 [Pitangus sulphuratus]